jgi:hypothetical protein
VIDAGYARTGMEEAILVDVSTPGARGRSAESLRMQVRRIGRTGRILAACGLDRTIVRVRNTLTHSDSLLDPSLHDLA